MFPIFDLHCDLLGTIEQDPRLNFESPETNCSLSQLNAGNVWIQTLAVASITKKGSFSCAQNQIALYEKLKGQLPTSHIGSTLQPKLQFILSIENASGLVEEDEPLKLAFERFHGFSQVAKIAYVSLTWNDENRFGGGNSSTVGLKEDGRVLLEFLSQYPVAIDLSHTSDALAYDILDWIHSQSLPLKPIASHSNFRPIQPVARNLPDAIAKEIIHLQGLIGLNFVRRFVGNLNTDFIKHIEYGLSLKAENSLCFGADFYGISENSGWINPDISHPIFQPEFNNSSSYPNFQKLMANSLSQELIEKICYKNALRFFQNLNLLPGAI